MARPVCTSHDESGYIFRLDFLWPNPSPVNAPAAGSAGARIDTVDFTLRLSLGLLLARECATEWLRIPPGDGREAIWLMEAEVWSSEVAGSK